jgi:hypothetical protein
LGARTLGAKKWGVKGSKFQMSIADKNKNIGKNFIIQFPLFSGESLFFQREVNKIGINNEVIRTRGSIGVAAPPQKS